MGNEMSNPIVIMLINMTIVFAVLFVLSLYIRFIHFIDPTKPKATPVSAPKAEAPIAPPVERAEALVVEPGITGETVAAIAGALAAYGIGFSQIKSIRPAQRPNWAGAARLGGLRKEN